MTTSMTRTISSRPPRGAMDKGKGAVLRSPHAQEKQAGVNTRGREQQHGVKKKKVVGRKTTGKTKKVVTHISTK